MKLNYGKLLYYAEEKKKKNWKIKKAQIKKPAKVILRIMYYSVKDTELYSKKG